MFPDDSFSPLAQDSFWPPFLEQNRCPDALFAEAYEGLTPSCRGAIKTAIAMTFFHFGEARSRGRLEREGLANGFQERCVDIPVPWALCVISAQTPPAALIQACVLPALCGVEHIGAFCMQGDPSPPVLLALELCGVEDLFLTQKDALAKALRQLPPGGRVTVLGNGGDYCQPCSAPGVLWHAEDCHPLLFVPDPQNFDLDAISLAQACNKEELLAFKQGRIDGVYAQHADPCARLTLGPGLEAFWLLENYGPDFFRAKTFSFSASSS